MTRLAVLSNQTLAHRVLSKKTRLGIRSFCGHHSSHDIAAVVLSFSVMESTSVADVADGVVEAKHMTNGHPADLSHEEHQYLNLIREILANGEYRPDRCSP